MRILFSSLVLSCFINSVLMGQDDLTLEQPQKPLKMERLGVPMDAMKLALLDINNFSDQAIYFRYVWVPENKKENCDAVDIAVNTAISNSSGLVKGVRIGEHRLLRYDLRSLAPKESELKSLRDTWERMAEDEPYFLVPGDSSALVLNKDVIVITKDNAQPATFEKVLVSIPKDTELDLLGEKIDDDGTKWYKIQWQAEICFVLQMYARKESRKVEGKHQFKRVLGPHVGEGAEMLALATLSQVPIVRHDYFIRKVLSNVEGGLYYEFRGIVKSPNENQTDLEFLLESKFKARIKDFQDSRSDQKVAMFRSRVTGKPRATLFIAGARRVTVNQGLIVMTLDLDEDQALQFNDPFLDILKHKYQGIELFAELGNGMILYALYTGDLDGDGIFEVKNEDGEAEGALVREVPPQIATDHRVPPPYSNRLQPGISCMRCHNQIHEGRQQEGWIEHPNDVMKLVKAGLDIFGQRKDKQSIQSAIDRKVGLYTGDFAKVFRRARDDYADALLLLTGNIGTEEKSGVTENIDQLVKIYHEFWYELITPKRACQELGYGVETEEDAVKLLNDLLKPLPPNELGISPEDVRLGALKAGIAINRFQWEAVYPDAAERTIQTLLDQQPVKAETPVKRMAI